MCKNTNKITLPLWQGLFYPLTIIKNNNPHFLKLTSLFALIMTTVTFLLGISYTYCSSNIQTSFYCSNPLIPTIPTIIILIYLTSTYINRLILITSTPISFIECLKTHNFKNDLKTTLIILLNITAWVTISTSLILLTNRKATPDFIYELGYFTLFFLAIFVSIIYLLNNVLAYRFIENKNFLLLHKSFWATLDNLYKILLWFMLSFMFFSWIIKTILYILQIYKDSSQIFFFMGVYLLMYSILCISTYWIFQLQFQDKHIFKSEE